ncbi:hypothetical protein M885DRAFT_315652 [Pelagophyceae sp. CCMP2097]|nr:hypothetical protein M885DRAFT_315652 [Pelagophyceae sp. CCMP2097]
MRTRTCGSRRAPTRRWARATTTMRRSPRSASGRGGCKSTRTSCEGRGTSWKRCVLVRRGTRVGSSLTGDPFFFYGRASPRGQCRLRRGRRGRWLRTSGSGRRLWLSASRRKSRRRSCARSGARPTSAPRRRANRRRARGASPTPTAQTRTRPRGGRATQATPHRGPGARTTAPRRTTARTTTSGPRRRRRLARRTRRPPGRRPSATLRRRPAPRPRTRPSAGGLPRSSRQRLGGRPSTLRTTFAMTTPLHAPTRLRRLATAKQRASPTT